MRMSRILLFAALLSLAGCIRLHSAMELPQQPNPWVLRTDFSDDKEWSAVRDLISAPQTIEGVPGKFNAYVSFVSDEANRDKQPHELVRSLPVDYPFHFCFVVDRECIVNPERPVLVVGFYPAHIESFGRPPRDTPESEIATFRALPSRVQSIQNNLSIANLDFEDFATSVGDDGVFRGFAGRGPKHVGRRSVDPPG